MHQIKWETVFFAVTAKVIGPSRGIIMRLLLPNRRVVEVISYRADARGGFWWGLSVSCQGLKVRLNFDFTCVNSTELRVGLEWHKRSNRSFEIGRLWHTLMYKCMSHYKFLSSSPLRKSFQVTRGCWFRSQVCSIIVSDEIVSKGPRKEETRVHLNQLLWVVDCSLDGGGVDDDVDTHHDCHETIPVVGDELVDSSSCVHRQSVL